MKQDSINPPDAQTTLAKYIPITRSCADAALCAQACFFLYSTNVLPIDIFDDPYFKNMLKNMVLPNSEVKVPTLNEHNMPQHTAAELRLFEYILHKELSMSPNN